MNILYLINHSGKGGSEKYVYTLINYLKQKNNVYFVYNEYGPLCEEINKLNIPIMQINMSNPFDLKASFKIASFCKHNKIDIIHTQFQRESYICTTAKIFYNKFKLVYTCHINLHNSFFRKITNYVLGHRYDSIIAVSSIGKEILIQNKMPKDKIEVIFNGVKYENYMHNSTKSYILDEFKISKDTFVFSTLTRFSKEKGNLFLLKSVKELKSRTNKKFIVLFAGDGPLLAQAKQYTNENNLNENVIFMGYRKDSTEILKASNVFLNSSSNEALSFAILEAMSKALPIVATNIGGNKDIVNNTTNCGILVNYENTEDYAKAMKKLMEDKDFWQYCSNNSLKAIKNIFNLDKVLNKTLCVYERLINSVDR